MAPTFESKESTGSSPPALLAPGGQFFPWLVAPKNMASLHSLARSPCTTSLPSNQHAMTSSSSSSPPPIQSPSDYMVGVTIGEGAFGNVLFGVHKLSHTKVAIKVVLKLHVQHSSIIQEQRILSQCNDSPFIVKLYASFHDDQCLYLVMELCGQRGTLQHAMDSFFPTKNKEWKQQIVVAYYTSQILQALEYLHFQQNVIHADLKPANILLSESGQVKLCDFGSAIIMNDNTTTTTVPRGTADYAAPELIRNQTEDISPAVDVWSLGCIVVGMWNTSNGEGGATTSPFHAESDALCIDKIMKYAKEYNNDDNQVQWKDIPSEWNGFVKQLLHPNPVQRGDAKSIQSQYRELLQNDNVNTDNAPYLPPRPSWWNGAQSTTTPMMRDGSQGWTAFVMD